MVYPDFKMDKGVMTEIMQREKRMLLNDGRDPDEPEIDDDDLMFGGKANDKVRYRSRGQVMSGNNLPSVQCLKAFKGDYVVHVGELFGCTWSASKVWGKTTSMAFQVELQTHFHRVYQHELPRFPLFRDPLT